MFTSEETENWTLMACPDYEARIMDWLDGALSTAERQSLENHVGACAACRNFAEELKNLDAMLVQHRLNKDVRYDVNSGVVTLKGTVRSQAQRATVEKLAAQVPNVKQVVNELEVKNQKATSSR